jgi:hypothetical protein
MLKGSWTPVALALLLPILSVRAQPVKVYIFAGQSNMDATINKSVFSGSNPALYSWITNSANSTLYHYWRSGGGIVSTNWVHLSTPSTWGIEHVVAYRLWNYWQRVDPNQRIAVIKVSQGSTGLRTSWNPGGRDRRPWRSDGDPSYSQGSLHKTFTNRVQMALQQLTERDLEYEVDGFFWYQGEDDSFLNEAADNYAILFDDLLNGWTVRDPVLFPNDNPSLYGGSLRELCGLTNMPVVAARINRQIKGSNSWGNREVWEPQLEKVRAALSGVSSRHSQAAWIDVDDIPLSDNYHYSGSDSIEIGERFAQAWRRQFAPFGAMIQISSPVEWQQYHLFQTNILTQAERTEMTASQDFSLQWVTPNEGVFGSGESAVLESPGWSTRVTSVGSANNPDGWVYTTNHCIRIEVQADGPGGIRLSDILWIQRIPDQDEDGLPDAWELEHFGGYTNANAAAIAANLKNTLLEAYLADLDPKDPDAEVRVSWVEVGPPASVRLALGSTGRVYTLRFCTNLAEGVWADVSDALPRAGTGGADTFVDPDPPASAVFYKVDVRLP